MINPNPNPNPNLNLNPAQLYDEAWKQPKVLQGDVAAAAEYVWTSGKALNEGVLVAWCGGMVYACPILRHTIEHR